MTVFELTCKACKHCIQNTAICQTYNKSVADNSVHPWECQKFTPKNKHLQFIFPTARNPNIVYCGIDKHEQNYRLYFKLEKEEKELPK